MTDSTAAPMCPLIAAWEESNEGAVPITIASTTVTPTSMFDGRSGGDAMGFRERTMGTSLHNPSAVHHENPSPLPWRGGQHHSAARYGRGTKPERGSSQIPIQGGHEQRIEIVIEDRTFFLAKGGPLQVGTPLEIVVENRDQVRHGFTSSMLIGLLVSGEDDQIATYGKGVEGFYVNPGKTPGDPVQDRTARELSVPLRSP